MTARLLEIDRLSVAFNDERGSVHAVDQLSFDVAPGETLAIVGESGSGKTATALAMLRLIPPHQGGIIGGAVRFAGVDLATLREHEIERVRGAGIGMIFQEPMTSLNPVMRIGDQIAEPLMQHRKLDRAAARARARELLGLVRIPDPDESLDAYPHQFSGGMRQRAMIAMAVACDPKLLIADEPTTALDVTVQAQMLRLLGELAERRGMAMVLITHDLAVVAEIADRVVVMYAGRGIESGPVDRVLARPIHPYTRGLIGASIARGSRGRVRRLTEIPGIVPVMREIAGGCGFVERCAQAEARCRLGRPADLVFPDSRSAACVRGRELV